MELTKLKTAIPNSKKGFSYLITLRFISVWGEMYKNLSATSPSQKSYRFLLWKNQISEGE